MNKVLLICKETYTYPMIYIARRFLKDGYNVDVLFFHSSEVLYDDVTIKKFKECNPSINVITTKEVFDKYIMSEKNSEMSPDLEYLKYVESTFCKGLPISLLEMSSQLFTTQYHYRFFFQEMSSTEKLLYVELLFRFFEKLLSDNQYSGIYDNDIAEIGRSVLFQVAKTKNVDYVTLEFSRYNDFVLPCHTLGREVDQHFESAFNANLIGDIDGGYVDLVEDYRSKERLLSKDYQINNTSKIRSKSLLNDMKVFIVRSKEPLRRVTKWFRNGRSKLLANPLLAIVFFLLSFIRERYVLSKLNRNFVDPSPSVDFIYLPLHLIPESTTLVKSPFYPNEITLIEKISKVMPVGWKLYVKEHGAMIGERPISFYRKLNRLTNVQLVKLDSYDDPKDWISRSRAVITLTGTSAFEAVMLGKPCAIFGSVHFQVIPEVFKIDTDQRLLQFVDHVNSSSSDIESKRSCAAYLKTVLERGEKVPILTLIEGCKRSAISSEPLSNDVETYLDRLYSLYLKSIYTADTSLVDTKI